MNRMATLKRFYRGMIRRFAAAMALSVLGVLLGSVLSQTGWRGAFVIVCVHGIAAGLVVIVTGLTQVRHHRALVAYVEGTGQGQQFIRWLGREHHRTWVWMGGWAVVAVGVWWIAVPAVVVVAELLRRG